MDIPAHVLAHFGDGGVLLLPGAHHFTMADGSFDHLFKGRIDDWLPGQRRADLRKQKGIAQRSTADGQPVAACLSQGTQGGIGRYDIAVEQHGNAHRLFYARDSLPSGLTGILLLARAAVDGEQIGSALLGDMRKLGRAQVIIVPAQAHLDCDRQDGGFSHGGDNLRAQGQVTHQRAARA